MESSQLTEEEKSLAHTLFEHELGFWQACRFYWPALLWCFFVNLAVILCGFDGALIGSLIGLSPFNKTYGRLVDGSYAVAPSWLSAFNYAAFIGILPGSLVGGMAYDKFGPRVTLAATSAGSIGAIFLQFFSEGPAILFVGELFNGFITGAYPVIANAYISEVAPVAARGVAAALINLSYVIGQLVASGILKGTSTLMNKWSYKIPFATQWVLPLFILTLIFFCPSSTYWLCRNGRDADALQTLSRVTASGVNIEHQLANIKQTLRLEESDKENVSVIDCFRGTNLRRTLTSCMVFSIQALCGNVLFINYAVYFFETAGLSTADAFSMNVGLTCMGLVGTLASYILISYAGRRTIFLWGNITISILVFTIGVLGVIPHANTSRLSWGISSLIVLTNLVYDMSVGPLCYTFLSELSAVRLRGTTIAIATVVLTVFSIIFAVAVPYTLNATGANWGGKLGFLFAGIGFVDSLCTFFCLPETKHRTFEELDWMFQNKVPTRSFKGYRIEAMRAGNAGSGEVVEMSKRAGGDAA